MEAGRRKSAKSLGETTASSVSELSCFQHKNCSSPIISRPDLPLKKLKVILFSFPTWFESRLLGLHGKSCPFPLFFSFDTSGREFDWVQRGKRELLIHYCVKEGFLCLFHVKFLCFLLRFHTYLVMISLLFYCSYDLWWRNPWEWGWKFWALCLCF